MSKQLPLIDVRELHQDLERKYRNVGTKLEGIWRKFTPEQREQAIKESFPHGDALKHSRDQKPDNHERLMPDFNLRDMTPEPEYFLNVLKFRASTPLYNQIFEGTNQFPGDREAMKSSKMVVMDPAVLSREMTLFHDGEQYGQSYMPGNPQEEKLLGLLPDGTEYITVPRNTCGEIILARQRMILVALNLSVNEILHVNDPNAKKVTRTINKARVTATSNLAIEPRNVKSSSLPEVCALVLESKAALADYLHLLRTEPIVLNQAVNATFFSRKELVRDSQGGIEPSVGDRHLSVAFFEVVAMAIKAYPIWDYMLHLLELLDDTTDKLKRRLVVQELSNTLHLEYRRTQEKFKRMISPICKRADKCFKRTTEKSSGEFKVVIKGRPADYTVRDPQLHYILRLCDPETSVVDAAQWMQKLDDHNTRYADDRQKLDHVEMEALGDLAIVLSFKHVTSTAIPMTPVSQKSGFTARAAALEAELNSFKPKAKFGAFVVPYNHLLEPQIATDALAALDDLVMKETGARFGSLFENLVHDSLGDLEMIYTKAKTKVEIADKQTTYVPLPKKPSPPRDTRLTDSTAKEKTRPADSVYAITLPPETPQVVNTEPIQQYQVKTSTAALFNLLFSKSEARGSISWTDFESAMADLGFSITPTGGSIFTFNPPASMNTRPITLHRPHTSDIEGHLVFIFARRLQRAYGWTAESFSFA
jgi:hypothetical protein